MFAVDIHEKVKNNFFILIYYWKNPKLRLGAQSSYFVKYFEGSNAGKMTTMHN